MEELIERLRTKSGVEPEAAKKSIAAILTYVRKSWGNDASPISPETVQSIRGLVANRDEPWSDEELQAFR